MPEKFMILAVIGYVVFIFAAAFVSTFIPTHSGDLPAKQTFSGYFLLAFLYWMGTVAFLYFAHPFIYLLPKPLSVSLLVVPRLSLWVFLGTVITVCLLSQRIDRFCGATRHPYWWSPTPLLLALLTGAWFSLRMGQVGEFRNALWPDWRFVSVAAVLYGSCLILGNLMVWFTQPAVESRWNVMLGELARLSAVLPALLVYSLGLRV